MSDKNNPDSVEDLLNYSLEKKFINQATDQLHLESKKQQFRDYNKESQEVLRKLYFQTGIEKSKIQERHNYQEPIKSNLFYIEYTDSYRIPGLFERTRTRRSYPRLWRL